MNKKNKKIIFKIGIIIIFILLLITPISIGHIEKTNITLANKLINKKYFYSNYNIYNFPEYVAKEIFPDFYYQKDNFNTINQSIECSYNNYCKLLNDSITENHIQLSENHRDSPWPMLGYDTCHSGRSPYSTIDTWGKIWNLKIFGPGDSTAIDSNGTIYIGSYDLNAVYPNGTLKWKFERVGCVESCCPAIDENGVIYFGSGYAEYYLYAIYPNGTLKWHYAVGGIFTSPIIGSDGTIIFSDTNNWNIVALCPNGTLKWSYHTNHVIYSSPTIGLDGTIYCGSHDGNVYALYPNNGTLRWKYDTGSWVHGSASIAVDGTVYIGSDNGYLYAFYPDDGTVKWKINIGEIYGNLALDKDGTIYTGVWEKMFYAINPDGTIKWSFSTGSGKVWGSSPALSDDGTLYFGTCDLEWSGGVEIIALNTDGTLKWRKSLGTVFSSPSIGSDGTVYIGAEGEPGVGYLYAFGIGPLEADAYGPYYGLFNQLVQFKGTSIGGYSPHSYYWDFGDTYTSDEQNPIHSYTNAGNYTVTLTVTDNTSNTSTDTTWAWIQTTNTPPNKPIISGPNKGKPDTSYTYTFVTTDIDGTDISYYIDWGDNENTGWKGPYKSGKQITLSHTWDYKGTYTIKCKAKDPYNAESDWGTLEITMPRSKLATNSLLLKFLERFPILHNLLIKFISFS